MLVPGSTFHLRSVRVISLALPAVAAVLLMTSTTAYANVPLTQVSTDPYTDSQAQHRTEVEPDTFSFGGTAARPPRRS
jgi:hypothetical protein